MAEVLLPALGESVTEGIVTRWFKAVGDSVARDEPLFEISTDKVDSEVPSPAAGVLTSILAAEGDTVAVGAAVATIGGEAEAPAPTAGPVVEVPAVPAAEASVEVPTPTPAPAVSLEPAGAEQEKGSGRSSSGQTASPMVRRLLDDAGVPASSVRPSGPGGRITRADAEAALSAPVRRAPVLPAGPVELQEVPQGSLRSFVSLEADLDAVAAALASPRVAPLASEGIMIDASIMVARATAEVLAEFPMLNSNIVDNFAVPQPEINLGMTLDLEGNLLAPVVPSAQDLNLRGLARRLGQVQERARSGSLLVEDLLGGTFSVAVAASKEVLVAIPPLLGSQVAVLSLGGVAKRTVVLSGPDGDSIGIKTTAVIGLAYDTRVVDVTTATRFLVRLAEVLAERDWTAEL